METIKIWPQKIEGGEARMGGIDHTCLRFTDHEAQKDVFVFVNEQAISQLRAMFGPTVRH